ncbi:MAG TPA: C25 family cysteine peptidase [Ignavibacteria bacterium]|nr:C25 family cysteine peptidase [Ignavibacteria bacterium]
MRRTLLIFLGLFLLTNISRSQNYNWITPNKVYLKMSVADDGIYRINRTDFTNAGINTAAIDPRTVKVYNKGSQMPIFFQGESDGTFDVNDYFDFYGIRNYGGLTKTYTEDNNLAYTTNEYFSPYSDTNAYWIEWDGANGQRMINSTYTSPVLYPLPYFYDIVHLEKDRMYSIGENFNGSDYRNFTNEKFKGENWFWSLIGSGQSTSDTFSLPLLYTVPENSTFRIFAYPLNISTGIFNEHTITLKINGNTVSTITVNDFKKIDSTITFSSSLLSNVSVNTASVTYTSNGGFQGYMYIDLMEVSYPKLFRFRNNQALLPFTGTDTTSNLFRVSAFVPANPVNIYDVKNGLKINSFTNNADTLKFTGSISGKFEIVNKNITKKPLRIVQRQVPDLVSASNGTDYLLIYNTLFSSQAAQLKNYRQTKDNFRVTTAEISDLYDIFNYGLEDPVAIRNFVRHVYYNWQTPKVKYLCLFGRGSLDPKKNSSSTLYNKNYIPVFGNPTSDNYYANINNGGFTYYTNISIGRLPAYTVTEAQYMVDNIITYESQSPASWDKNFTFIAGGVDASEQSTFLPLNDSLIIPYVIPPPVSGNPVRILRNDLYGNETYNYSDSIKNQINRGTLTVNFMGHAGSQDWEIGMTDPNVLSNANGKFPYIFSMTCYTGKSGEPNFRVFGERFMTMNNKGAIGYVGTSGWGFVFAGSQLNNVLYKAIARDSLRRIGDIFSSAIYNIRSDSGIFSSRHTINCYTLLGDPAAKLLLPRTPEYSISQSDYKLTSASPAINEPVTFTAYPKNFGLYSDSCNIRFQILFDNSLYMSKDTTVKNFKFSDSVKFSFVFSKSGFYTLKLSLDNFNLNPNENKSDNELSVQINTRNISFIPFKPVNNSVIKSDSVELVGLNPFIKKGNKSMNLQIELDTTLNFNSPVKKFFVNKNITGVTSKFKTLLPVLDTNVIYYWRTNSIIENDTSGWSMYQVFRYNPVVTDSKDFLTLDTSVLIYKNKSQQFSELDFSNSNFSAGGVRLSDYTGKILSRSYGSIGTEASYFNVLSRSIHIDAGSNTGLNLLKIRKTDGAIIQMKNIKMNYANSSDTVVSFLNTFDSTHYLLGLNASYVGGGMPFTPAARNKFFQFSATKVDSFTAGFFDTWSFIGYLNAPLSDVAEESHKYNNAWIESLRSMDRIFTRTSGTVSNIIGPANSWKNFSWQNTVPNGSSLKFDVYGIDRNEQQVLLFSNLTTNSNVDLSSINSYQYPKLNLKAKLNIDTLSGLRTSVLNSVKANYTLPSEIIPDPNSFIQFDSSLIVGDELKYKFRYYNVGNTGVPGVVVNTYKTSVSAQNFISSDTVYKQLDPDSSGYYSGKVIVPNIRMLTNTALIVVEILPASQLNEFYTFNNYSYLDVKLFPAPSADIIELFSDGQLVRSGDYVSLKPEFKINLNSFENISKSSDSTQYSLILNNKYIPHFVNGNPNSVLRELDNNPENLSKNSKKTLVFFPELTSGENNLKIIYRNGNGSYDSTDYSVLVSNELQIKDFYNYPNPMKGETSFIFNLLGSETPPECRIKIYTVGGRLIKEINYNPVIGLNKIPWDGKDSDGDIIANGTYLYKLYTEDTSGKETAVQKLVILR